MNAVRRIVLLLLLAATATAAPAAAQAFPNDPGSATRGGPAGGWQDVQWDLTGPFGIRVREAWAAAAERGGAAGRGVRVALLDAGVAYRRRGPYRRSPDLAGVRILPSRDFVDGDREPIDESDHGTFVAGIIAAQIDNGYGLAGIAPGVELLPVRIVDRRDETDPGRVAAGIRYAIRRRADVINLSVQGPFDEATGRGRSITAYAKVRSALTAALRAGVVVVAAAGNDSQRDIPGTALRDLLYVGATTERGCLADYSNTGPGLDLVAPGGGRDAVVAGDPQCRPDEEPGRAIAQVTFRPHRPGRFLVPDDFYGTSMAAPHVTGAVALLLASEVLGRRPTPRAVGRRLARTARDLGAPGPDRAYGAGLLDAAAAITAPR